MTSSKRQFVAIQARRISVCAALLCALTVWSSVANAETVRDNFEDEEWDNNDGSVNWSGDWIEVDGDETPPSPNKGDVEIDKDELVLLDKSEIGIEPSAAREANLAGATIAVLRFDWRAEDKVDLDDSVVVEVSANGGGSWTTLEDFTGIDEEALGSRAYNISAYATANTQIRFRINNGYTDGGEKFFVEYVEIEYYLSLSGADLSITQTDSPDPVNVASDLSYSLTVKNNGPDDATGVTVVDTLPAGVNFESVSASQGSCSHSGGVVTCSLGTMVEGANATINIVVTSPVVIGTITNSATVSGNQTDTVAINDTDNEDTTVVNLNINQLCYLVADDGPGGNNLFTRIDTADFNPATNETNIGSGTGTGSIEAIAFNSITGVVYAANGGRLGTLSTTSGLFAPRPQTFGTGSGVLGNVTFGDVDGLAFDAGEDALYGVHARSGTDVLIQIDMATGAHIPNAFGAGLDYVPLPPIGGNTITDDIAIDPTTGVMYAAVNGGGVTDRLITINKVTGATTDVALITVPDIEGLGTDPTGQLWGTSGTQDILYEINKFTGVGSNGRDIDNGGDYEAVDCYAFSPSVIADLDVAKTVDDATPAEDDTINYTITVTNAGPSSATVVQVMDLLPAGVTFVSATPGQGTYDAVSGDWFVGSLAVGNNATLTLQATVDAGSGGTTITNTANVDFLSQVDPNPGNDIASVDINPLGTPDLTVVKAMLTLEDPISGGTDPKNIPGATVRYLIVTTNSGNGPVDNDTLFVIDPIPANLGLRVIDFDVSTPGPVQFIDGSTTSGLTYNFVALGDPNDDVSFSDDNGVTFDYEPIADANGVDLAVTDIRINPKGSFAGSTAAGDPSLQIAFKAIIQ